MVWYSSWLLDGGSMEGLVGVGKEQAVAGSDLIGLASQNGETTGKLPGAADGQERI